MLGHLKASYIFGFHKCFLLLTWTHTVIGSIWWSLVFLYAYRKNEWSSYTMAMLGHLKASYVFGFHKHLVYWFLSSMIKMCIDFIIDDKKCVLIFIIDDKNVYWFLSSMIKQISSMIKINTLNVFLLLTWTHTVIGNSMQRYLLQQCFLMDPTKPSDLIIVARDFWIVISYRSP